jgi:tetratricopeptide (TPR) repeat protein
MGNIYNKGTAVVPRDFEEAMKWYDMAAKQHNPDAQNNYAWLCYLKKENIEKGLAYIKEALEKTPDDIHRLDTYACLLFLQGKYDEAEKAEKKALDGGGDKKVSYLERYGDIQIQLGNKDEAIRYWKMAQQMDGHSDKLAEKLSTEKYTE